MEWSRALPDWRTSASRRAAEGPPTGAPERGRPDLCDDAEASIVDERGRECVQADDVDAVQRGDADDVVVRRLVGRLVAARTLRQLHHTTHNK